MTDFKPITMPHENANPTTYVVGFAFDCARFSYPSVCLIEKQKPEWQKGFLNGVGGKKENGESEDEAMAREFYEETGVQMSASDWIKFFVMRFRNGAVVHCFTARLPDDQTPVTMEAEQVEMHSIGHSGRWYKQRPIIDNLNWLIPMAFHELHRPEGERMIVDHEDEDAQRYRFIRNQKESLYSLIADSIVDFGIVDLADFPQFDELDQAIDRVRK